MPRLTQTKRPPETDGPFVTVGVDALDFALALDSGRYGSLMSLVGASRCENLSTANIIYAKGIGSSASCSERLRHTELKRLSKTDAASLPEIIQG